MEVSVQPKLKFHGVDIFRVEFVSQQPSIGKSAEVRLTITPYLHLPEGQSKVFKIFMEVAAVLDEHFTLSLSAVGTFESEGFDDQTFQSVVDRNAPAIMFPYIRSFVTSFTSSLGNVTGPVVVPPHFFLGKVEKLEVPKDVP